MSEIVIRIFVPDGSTVRVEQNGNDRPFVERPDPPEPEGWCPVHDEPWKLVPSGVSKRTGKRYNSFWACSVKGCDERPPRAE